MAQSPPARDALYDYDPYRADPPAPRDAFRRAARALWVTGTLFALLGGACGLMFAAVGATPFDQLVAQGEGRFTPEQIDTLRGLHPLLLGVAAALGLVLFLPGLVMLVLGFFVRRGSRFATVAALTVTILELLLIAFAGLSSIVNAVLTADLAAALTAIVMFGVPVALLVWTTLRLLQARRALNARGHGDDHPHPDDDPWETAI